jgi:hypothetical protein
MYALRWQSVPTGCTRQVHPDDVGIDFVEIFKGHHPDRVMALLFSRSG